MFSQHVTVHFLSFSDPVEPTVPLVHSGSKYVKWRGGQNLVYLCFCLHTWARSILCLWRMIYTGLKHNFITNRKYRGEKKKRFRHINIEPEISWPTAPCFFAKIIRKENIQRSIKTQFSGEEMWPAGRQSA